MNKKLRNYYLTFRTTSSGIPGTDHHRKYPHQFNGYGGAAKAYLMTRTLIPLRKFSEISFVSLCYPSVIPLLNIRE